MAVTSIWAVTHHIDNTITYIVNPEKTIERPELSQEAINARKAVGDVIDYASNGDKTDQMMYVTGINCSPDTAVDEFLSTKRYWGKTDGRLAYHGYQAFKEGDGEISAETAHKIGVELAQELWGDRFEVVIATHLNTGHLHNHFVVNSVSFIDGLKYRRTKADYRQMRAVSDRLCKEAKLHVVEDFSFISPLFDPDDSLIVMVWFICSFFDGCDYKIPAFHLGRVSFNQNRWIEHGAGDVP